jgi:hypothetical protein
VKAITLRNIPPRLARRISRRAVQDGTSLNRTVIRMLDEATSVTGPQARPSGKLHRDLDHLAGSWSRERAAEFDAALAEQRRIDPELWR